MNIHKSRWVKRHWIGFLVVCISGCAVGPNYHPPAAPKVDGYTAKPLPNTTASADTTGGGAQQIVPGGDIPAQWWTLFHSKPLDLLVRAALQNSPTLKSAQAALRQAHENYLAEFGNLFPSFDLSLKATRQKTSGALFGNPGAGGTIYSLYNAQVQVSYGLDLFGGERRAVEESRAKVDYQRYELKGAWLTLTSNVVTTAVQAASVRAQIAATEDVNRAQRKVLKVLRTQERLGGAAGSAVLQQEAQVAQALANLPPLRKQLAQTEDQLAVLIGRFPSNANLPPLKLDELHLPEHLPLSLPSSLVRQRPDIRAAAAQLHSASAAVGVAIANQLPQITITGDLGSVATDPGKLLSPGGGIWSIAGGLTQPIFHGGQLLHQKRAAVAAYEQAAADYRSTVLNAFQNVADALHAIDQDADALKAQLAAERAAHRSYQISRQQYRDGAVSYTAMLQSSLTWQQARVKLAQAQANRYADTAALFQALGGGWWASGRASGADSASASPAAASSTTTAVD